MSEAVTDTDIRQLRADAAQVHNSPLALLCSRALTGDEDARARVAQIISDSRKAQS